MIDNALIDRIFYEFVKTKGIRENSNSYRGFIPSRECFPFREVYSIYSIRIFSRMGGLFFIGNVCPIRVVIRYRECLSYAIAIPYRECLS